MFELLKEYEYITSWVELLFFILVFIFFEFRQYKKKQLKEKENDVNYKLFFIYKKYLHFILEQIALHDDVYIEAKKNFENFHKTKINNQESIYSVFRTKNNNLNYNVIKYFFATGQYTAIVLFMAMCYEIDKKNISSNDKQFQKVIQIIKIKSKLKYNDFIENKESINRLKKCFKNDEEIADLYNKIADGKL